MRERVRPLASVQAVDLCTNLETAFLEGIASVHRGAVSDAAMLSAQSQMHYTPSVGFAVNVSPCCQYSDRHAHDLEKLLQGRTLLHAKATILPPPTAFIPQLSQFCDTQTHSCH